MLKNRSESPDQEGKTSVRKRGSGASLVYETIRDEILELKLAPGTAVDETGLAARFNMSRSPIREALVKLSAEGLVRTLANRSTIVTPIDLIEFPQFVAALDYIQRLLTRLAAKNRTEADIEAMVEAAKAYDAECLTGEPLRMSLANKEFHMRIADGGHNPYLSEFYAKMLDEGRRLLHIHYARNREASDPYPLNSEHFEMIEAIRTQNEAEADRLAHQHTRMLHRRLIDFMRVNYLEQP